MPKINKTKYALLGVLSLNPASGYDIKKFCDFSIAHFWNENYGHIYPVLKRMEAEGLVIKKTERTSGRPERNVYSISEKGRRELHEWLQLPVEQEPVRMEMMLKLFFSSAVPLANSLEKVIDYGRKHQELLNRLLAAEEMLLTEDFYKNQEGLPFWLATVNYGKHHSRAAVQWASETELMLKGVSQGENALGR